MLPSVASSALSASSSSWLLKRGRTCVAMHNRIVMPSTVRRAVAARSTSSSSSGRTLLFRRSPMTTTCPGPLYRPRTAVTAPAIPSVTRSNVARRTFHTPEPDLEPKFTPKEELVLDATAWTIAAVLAYSTFVLYADDEDDDEHLLDAHNEERNKYRQEQKEFHERRRAMKERTDQERLDRTRLRRQQRQQRSGQAVAATATAVCHEETGADRRREAKADVDEKP